jgi:hypothetical protein
VAAKTGCTRDLVPYLGKGLAQPGLIQIAGSGRTWTAKITAEGTRLLKEQSRRVEAERERERREEHARAERERELQRLRARALEVLEAVTAAGGRLDLDAGISERRSRRRLRPAMRAVER